MKKITFLMICLMVFSFAHAQLNTLAIVGDGAGGWPGEPGNPGPIDLHQMTTSDGINWTINNLALTVGSVKFRGNDSWDLPYNWGGATFPSGTAIIDGANITSIAGIYNVTFNSDTFAYSFVLVTESDLNSVAIVGDGAGGWPGEPGNDGPIDLHQMGTTDGENWTINNLALTVGSVKFRGNNSWDLPYNWGGTDFPSGTATVNADGITTVAGIYNISFNSTTSVYNFELIDSGLTSLAIVGDGVGGWPGDAGNPGPTDLHQLTSTDGENWTINNLTLTEGAVKFRGNNSWDLPYNWGGTDFPSGTTTVNADGITTVPGTYNVTFNSTTGVYSFETLLGIDDVLKNQMIAYPNPSTMGWHLKSSQNIHSIQIYDALGKQLMALKTNSNFITIDNSSLQTGIYMAHIQSDIGMTSVKLIKK